MAKYVSHPSTRYSRRERVLPL